MKSDVTAKKKRRYPGVPRPVVMFILLLLLGPSGHFVQAQATGHDPVIAAVHVDIQGGTPQRQAQLKDMAQKMIRFQPGDRFTPQGLDTTISLLTQSRQFSAIEIDDPDMAAASITLVFRLTPVMLIRDIQVTGAFPVFSQTIVNATDYFVGSPFFPDQVEKNTQAIESVMAENGYVAARVRIRPEPGEGLQVDVVIDVEKNEPLRTVEIEINGNTVFSDTRLKMRMKSWQLPLFFWSKGKKTVQKELDTDSKNLLAFYRKKGYVEAQVDTQVHTDLNQKITRVVFDIDEGPLYRVEFLGNKKFGNRTLKKDLTIWTKGNRNDFGLRRSIKNISDRYQKAGFKDCEVSFTAEITPRQPRPVRNIRIHITENTRYLVRSATVTGAQSLDVSDFFPHLNTREKKFLYDGPFVENMPTADRQTLENIYAGKGFEQTRVSAAVTWDEPDEKNRAFADVVFDVTEGYRRQVTQILFEGVSDEALAAELRNLLKTGEKQDLVPSQVNEDRRVVLSHLAEKGYIYADVRTRIEPDGKDGKVVFQVTPGSPAAVGGVWVFGNFDTREDVILRRNTLEENEPVFLNGFLSLQREIRDLQCLERANFSAIGIQENLDQVFFTASVEEKKPYFIDTSIGYDTARDAYLGVAAGNRNLLGTNRRLYLNAQISGIGYETILGITDFDFLASRVYSDFNVFASEEELKNQNFGTKKYGSSLLFEKQFTENLKLGTSFGLESREQYPTGNFDDQNPDIYATRGIVAATPFVTWSSVDSHARPTRGFYVNASAGYYRDILEDLDNFMKYQVKAKYYIQPFSRLVLAFQGMYGTIQNFSPDAELPDDQLFFLGGISNVRGIDENELVVDAFGDPVGGKTQMAGSIEARIDLGNNFELPVFLDAGSLRDTTRPGTDEGFKFTAGSGLRYMTPVGPVGLLYGHRLNPETGESSGKIHFSIGYTF
jgi:outer membrane protein insertion porin family